MEEPKDYVIQNFEDLLKEEYNSLSTFEKILYRLQDYIILSIFVSLVIGYLVGLYFGMFYRLEVSGAL